jgi:hypothetical protein
MSDIDDDDLTGLLGPAFDDFEQHHPPGAALDFLLYDVVCDLVPTDDDTRFGQTWVDHLVAHADHDLQAGPARWVRLAVGLTSDEYQLSNAELEAIQRVRGSIGLTATATLSPGSPSSISAHMPSYCVTASRPSNPGIRTGS